VARCWRRSIRAAAGPWRRAIVLTGAGGQFSGGADIREFGTPASLAAPRLHDVIAACEGSAKPVIAAISGVCLGGGFEIALGCHFRVARADARVGLPEVKLGLLPGAGGTQRLPRLVGVTTALNVILGGEQIPAREFANTALFDRVVEVTGARGGRILRSTGKAGKLVPRKVSEIALQEPNLEALCEFALQTVKAKAPLAIAPQRCIECVKAAGKPFRGRCGHRAAAVRRTGADAGVERPATFVLRGTRGRKSGRHSRFDAAAPAREGSSDRRGNDGIGNRDLLLNAGIPTWLLETDQAALDKGVARIAGIYDAQVRKGKLLQAERDKRMGLLQPVLKYESIGSADIVIEAVFERMDVKLGVFAELDRVMKSGAILATNTSTLDVNAIARPRSAPRTCSARTSSRRPTSCGCSRSCAARRRRRMRWRRRWRWASCSGRCPWCPGSATASSATACSSTTASRPTTCSRKGASPRQVDAAMEAFGFAMGPFKVGDLAGNDIGWSVRKRRRAEKPGYRFSTLPDKLCEMGRFGQKTGSGWYEYPDGRKPLPSRVVDELIAEHRQWTGDHAAEDRRRGDRRPPGLRAGQRGRANPRRGHRGALVGHRRGLSHGYGFPAMRGGPMFHADSWACHSCSGACGNFARNGMAIRNSGSLRR
jgi:3-hydroxyacyl-CoA dehydrogenase